MESDLLLDWYRSNDMLMLQDAIISETLSAFLSLCLGNSIVTDGFPSQEGSDVDHLLLAWTKLPVVWYALSLT